MAVFMSLSPEDAPVVAAMRDAAKVHRGDIIGPEARPMFDAMLAQTPPAEDVRFEVGSIGGITGLWCRPAHPLRRASLLFLHGGGYVLGSSQSHGALASQLARRIGVNTFVPDYRLAPEHPFPAALDDTIAAYLGLVAEPGHRAIVAGDSAGGGLTLALLSHLVRTDRTIAPPLGAAVLSPWVDLSLSGESMETRSKADPIFARATLAHLAALYLDGAPSVDPRASPLFAVPGDLPPVRIDVGDDEILLDDAIRYAEAAEAAGSVVQLVVWEGMPHVFQSSSAMLHSARQSLDAVATFLAERLSATN